MNEVVISLCDLTGVMVEPWVAAGYDAVLVDPQHGKYSNDGRIERLPCTVLEAACRLGEIVRGRRVALVAGFPPCTDVAVSGARWFASKAAADKHFQTRAALVAEQCRMIGQISGAPWFFENPVSVFGSIFGRADHSFHPHHFTALCGADNYTKLTCLWSGGGFVMPESCIEPGIGAPDNRIHAAPPGPDRANFRSATPRGFSRAVYMANARHLRRQLTLWEAATDNILSSHSQMMRKAELLQPLTECRECGERLSEARQRAVKGVQYCVACGEAAEQREKGYRRG